MPQYVYVIKAGDHIKIGRSTNPNKRLMTIQGTCPVPACVVETWQTIFAGEIELEAHRALSAFRTSGEWFALAPLPAIIVIDTLVNGRPRNPASRTPEPTTILICAKCNHAGARPHNSKKLKFRCSQCGHRDVHAINLFVKGK